jgi:hypothetical protein
MNLKWLDTIRADLSTILGSGAVTTALLSWATHAATWQEALPVVVGGAVAVLWPQTKNGAAAMTQAATDLIAAGTAVAAAKTPSAALTALTPFATPLVSDAAAALQLVSAVHASAPPGSTVVTTISGGTAQTTTTVPLPVATKGLAVAAPLDSTTTQGTTP